MPLSRTTAATGPSSARTNAHTTLTATGNGVWVGVVRQLAPVPLSGRPFRAENGLWPSGNAVCLWSCEAVS